MKIEAAVREYIIEIEIRKYTPKTIKGYRNNLNLFVRFCAEKQGVYELEDISLGLIRQYTQFLVGQGKKGTYVNGILKSIDRTFLSHAERFWGCGEYLCFQCKPHPAVSICVKTFLLLLTDFFPPGQHPFPVYLTYIQIHSNHFVTHQRTDT